MMYNIKNKENKLKNVFFIDNNVFPQIKAVIETRCKALNIEIIYGDYDKLVFDNNIFGVLIQYPGADGKIVDYIKFVEDAHNNDVMVCVVADLLSLTLLSPPGEWNADVVVGSTQRFGLPMSYGGPAAAFFATKEEFKRFIPGRIIGESITRSGKKAYRMALQMREQHIKREKATSNICTSQVLTAIIAGMYAVYHGPAGLKNIALNIHSLAFLLSERLKKLGFIIENEDFFDTLKII